MLEAKFGVEGVGGAEEAADDDGEDEEHIGEIE